MEHTVVKLTVNGDIKTFKHDHRKINELFGGKDYGFCGMLIDQNVVALSLMEKTELLNPFCAVNDEFFQTVHGDIILVGNDTRSKACDVNVEEVLKVIQVPY